MKLALRALAHTHEGRVVAHPTDYADTFLVSVVSTSVTCFVSLIEDTYIETRVFYFSNFKKYIFFVVVRVW